MIQDKTSIVSEVEIIIVNKPITDNSGETLETINLTSAFEISAQAKDIVVKVSPTEGDENKKAG